MNKSELTELKKNFLKQYNIYCKRFLENHNSKDYLKKQTKLVDQILIKIWKSFSVDNISLVAVGGYGRKELFPYSDVDILIIFEKEISKDEQDSISQFVTNCWDLGLKIGHSVRNIKETKYEFKKDITTATNLIESRFIVGSISVFNKLKHAIPNFFFTSTTILINFSLAFLLLKSSDWVSNNYFGLIHLYDFPLWIKVMLGILLLDLVGAYLAHYVEHNVKPLWMIHLVHHSDHKVDTTTANRHHPLESLIRFSFTLFGVFVSGAPIGVVMLYQSLSIISTQFTHANIKLSKKLDKFIRYIFVSPDMHKIHHHFRLPYTDKNYGNIFSIWDRIFGTFIYYDREKIKYGVDVFPDEDKNSNIKDLLVQPFQKYQKPTLSDENYKE